MWWENKHGYLKTQSYFVIPTIHTHCFKGVYFPVKAFNISWPITPPREAARGEKHPRDVKAKFLTSFSSRVSA